ncbi:MAG TPA: DUF4136 domain-containing protein [Flavitalea sp.]|nr:DUF4136 domain-containing protein [Flavitalea sp.]
MNIRNIYTGSFLTGLVALLMSCGTVAHVEKDPEVNLNNYRTFSWIEEGNRKSEGKSYNDFQVKYLRDIVTRELEKSGWHQVRSNPDALIDYDIMIENNVQERSESVYSRPTVRYIYNPYTRRVNSVYYPSQYLGQNYYDVPYKSGTITVNIVDTKSNNLIWQGWTETEIASRKLSQDDIQKAVKSIFKKFDVAKR